MVYYKLYVSMVFHNMFPWLLDVQKVNLQMADVASLALLGLSLLRTSLDGPDQALQVPVAGHGKVPSQPGWARRSRAGTGLSLVLSLVNWSKMGHFHTKMARMTTG